MRRIFNVFWGLFFTTLLLPQMALTANDRGMFWELKTKNATVYMFGSIHLADSSFYPLRTEIEEAFASSGTLAVEVDILNTDPMQAQMFALKYGMYPAGESLSDHVSKETMEKLQKAMTDNQLPIPMAVLDRQRPGLILISMGYLLAMKSGLNVGSGLDMHFLKQANLQNKAIVELEGAEFLTKVVSSLGPAEFMIRAALDQLDGYEEEFAKMIKAWKEGDEEAFTETVFTDAFKGSEAQPMMDILLYERNVGMANKIEHFIKQGGTYFVVVGAAHLMGKKSVPELLKKTGYKVFKR